MTEKQEAFIILSPGFAASETDSTCLPMQQQFVKSLGMLYPGVRIIVLSFQYPYHQKEYEWHGARIIPFDGKNKGGLLRLLLRKKVYSVLKKLNGMLHRRLGNALILKLYPLSDTRLFASLK